MAETFPGTQFSVRLNEFAQFLRANDIRVDPTSLIDIHTLAAGIQGSSRQQMLFSTRACACSCPRDWNRYEALFNTFWQADGEPLILSPEHSDDTEARQDSNSTGSQRLIGLAGTSNKKQQEEELLGAGDFKALSLADFRFVFDARQMRQLEKLVDRVARKAKKRVSRRDQTSRRGSLIDLRKSNRRALRYQGKPLELLYRRKKPRLRRFVLLLDISQSMDVYARLFMRFTRILMTVFQRSDAFVFNTELSELGQGHTRLSEGDFELILNKSGKGWLGGTRIADSLQTFNKDHLKNCVDTKTTVLIFSDGCDTDTPQALAEQVQIIQRKARRLIWVNPLLGRFEPGEADRYMDPVVPFVDRYCSAHNLNSLIELEHELLT